MIRNLKVLGLALMAVFALGAMAASGASAVTGVATFEAGKGTLDITETGEKGQNALTAFGGTVECPGSTYAGHKIGTTTTPPTPIENGETTITVAPTYVNCITEGLPMTIDMNGCDYVFHVGETTGGVEGTYGVTADIVCTGTNHIQITVFAGSSHLVRLCTLTVTSTTGLTGPHLTNTAASGSKKNDVDITGTLEHLHVDESGSCTSEPTTTTEGIFHIDATITGTNSEGKEIGVTISHA